MIYLLYLFILSSLDHFYLGTYLFCWTSLSDSSGGHRLVTDLLHFLTYSGSMFRQSHTHHPNQQIRTTECLKNRIEIPTVKINPQISRNFGSRAVKIFTFPKPLTFSFITNSLSISYINTCTCM